MKKFVTVLMGCSLALAAGVQAKQEEANPKNKKSKPVQKQQFAPKPQQHMAPNTHVQTMPKQYNNPTLQNNAKIHANNGSPRNTLNTRCPRFSRTTGRKSRNAPSVKPNIDGSAK